ncbi:type IV toxin-antitoxin system AbiEi family antitoxin domain-containing protein [Kribbella sp. NPDC050281]|uniref:type IV toxin-antitoxin system AbiEi family antitoxin domain-containing protein n=1 Tax=Kribbella sp. NPDC050281 TaxID=3155515 RepID=UPI0033FCD933
MNTKLMLIAAGRGDWFTRADACAAGYTDADIHRRVTAGRWIRLTRGAYAQLGSEFASMAAWDRAAWLHLRSAKAVYQRLAGRAVVSHQSALLLYGVQVSELDLRRVHVTRVSGLGRSGSTVCQHAARPPIGEPVEQDGVLLTRGARAVVEASRAASYPVAVSVVDQALRRRVATAEQLAAALSLFEGRPGNTTATRAVLFADGRSESVGESRLRVMLADLGLPVATLQAEIRDEHGALVARVDFLLAECGVVIEFDGAIKYGDGTADALIAEKVREDRLRDLGSQVVRVSWPDFARPLDLLARIRRAIGRSQPGSIAGYVTAGQ